MDELRLSEFNVTTPSLHVRNRIATYSEGSIENADLVLELDRDVWLKNIVGQAAIGISVDEGAAQLTGERTQFDELISLFS